MTPTGDADHGAYHPVFKRFPEPIGVIAGVPDTLIETVKLNKIEPRGLFQLVRLAVPIESFGGQPQKQVVTFGGECGLVKYMAQTGSVPMLFDDAASQQIQMRRAREGTAFVRADLLVYAILMACFRFYTIRDYSHRE